MRLFWLFLILLPFFAIPARAEQPPPISYATALHLEQPADAGAVSDGGSPEPHPAAVHIDLATTALQRAAISASEPHVDPIALGNGLLEADVAIKDALAASGIPVDWWARHPSVRMTRDVLLITLALAGAGAIIYGQGRAASRAAAP